MSTQRIKWSYSGLKDYQNCPRQYHEVKVLKNFSKKTTPQMLYGTTVHSALEDYVREGKPLAKNYQQYQRQLDPLREMPGDKYPEHRMALDVHRAPCSYNAEDCWVRGIADLLVVDGDQGYVVDYKTGSNRFPDPKQLQLMALMTFAHFPEGVHVKGGLQFVAHEHFVTSEYHRDNINDLWKDFDATLERLKISHEKNMWQPNPTPLCGWCPVSTCEFNKQR